MAVAFDASSTHGLSSASPAGTASWSHTTAAASGVILLVGGVHTGGTNQDPSSITYGGQALTKIDSIVTGTGATEISTWLYYMVNPSTGANTILVTFAASSYGAFYGASYNGVDVGNPLGTPDTDQNSVAAINVSVTSGGGELVVDAVGRRAASTRTVDASQTQRVDNQNSDNSRWIGASEEAGAATVSMDWTFGSSNDTAQVGVSLKPSAGRSRVVKYLHNTYMSRLAGMPVVLDVLGRQVPTEQIEFDSWMRVDGPFFPTSRKFSSTVEDPGTTYIESIRTSRGKVTIETAKESLLESLLRRLGGRS